MDLQDLRALLDLFITTPVRDIWGAFIRAGPIFETKNRAICSGELKEAFEIWGKKPTLKSAYIPLTHTHIHQFHPAGLLVHLQRQYNPTELSVRSQALSGIHPQSLWSPCAFTGMHLQSHWAPCAFTGMHPQTNSQSRCPAQPFPRS